MQIPRCNTKPTKKYMSAQAVIIDIVKNIIATPLMENNYIFKDIISFC